MYGCNPLGVVASSVNTLVVCVLFLLYADHLDERDRVLVVSASCWGSAWVLKAEDAREMFDVLRTRGTASSFCWPQGVADRRVCESVGEQSAVGALRLCLACFGNLEASV
ncbi:hypothetical protein ABZP36_023043 [Zizania latifolia]